MKLIDCPLYNILADMSYIVITETRETIILFILKNIDQVCELSNWNCQWPSVGDFVEHSVCIVFHRIKGETPGSL